MDGEAKIILMTAIVAAAAAVLIVLMWPRRRFREFVVRRPIDATAERIWEAFKYDPDNPSSAAFNDVITASRIVSTDPEIVEHMVDASGRLVQTIVGQSCFDGLLRTRSTLRYYVVIVSLKLVWQVPFSRTFCKTKLCVRLGAFDFDGIVVSK